MLILKNIKKGIVLVTLFQACNATSVKEGIIKNDDTSSFEIENTTLSLKDTFLINDFSVNGLRLDMPIKNVKKQLLLCDSIKISQDGVFYYVHYQNEVIMAYNSYGSSITWIEVFSPLFHTKSGFRVGDNIKELIKEPYREMHLLEKKETFWLGLYYDLDGFIEYIVLYDTGGFP